MKNNKIKIAIFYGSNSVEHDISCISAIQAYENYDKEKYDIELVYVSKENKMFIGDKLKDLNNYKDLNTLKKQLKEVLVFKENNKNIIKLKNKKILFDIAHLIFHGNNGEDGSAHGYFNFLNIPYIGSNTYAASFSQDKINSKIILKENKIPVLDYEKINFYDYLKNNKKEMEKIKRLKMPIIIKPATLGSSIGISYITKEKEYLLQDKLIDSFNYDDNLLIEKGLVNFEEFNCSVFGFGNEIYVSDIEKVFKKDEILSFKDKYLSGSTKKSSSKGMASLDREFPAKIDKKIEKEIKNLSIDVFKSLNHSSIIRIDFIRNLKNKKIYVNEINSIPGSLSYYLWEKQFSFGKLLDMLVKISLKKISREKSKTIVFDSNVLKNYKKNNKG